MTGPPSRTRVTGFPTGAPTRAYVSKSSGVTAARHGADETNLVAPNGLRAPSVEGLGRSRRLSSSARKVEHERRQRLVVHRLHVVVERDDDGQLALLGAHEQRGIIGV